MDTLNNPIIVLTPRMIRDTLYFRGPMGCREICEAMSLSAKTYNNHVMTALIDLMDSGEVIYNLETGVFQTRLSVN